MLDKAAEAAATFSTETTQLVGDAEQNLEACTADSKSDGKRESAKAAADRFGCLESQACQKTSACSAPPPPSFWREPCVCRSHGTGDCEVEVHVAEVEERRQAAKAVFTALSKAEEAASSAAAASGELESALQQAEQQAGGSWWGWNSPNANNTSTGILDWICELSVPICAHSDPPLQVLALLWADSDYLWCGGMERGSCAARSEPQEHDGMAYPSSPFIAATQDLDGNSPQRPRPRDGAASKRK